MDCGILANTGPHDQVISFFFKYTQVYTHLLLLLFKIIDYCKLGYYWLVGECENNGIIRSLEREQLIIYYELFFKYLRTYWKDMQCDFPTE